MRKIFIPLRFINIAYNSGKKIPFNGDRIIKNTADVKIYFHNVLANTSEKCKKVLVIHDLTPLHDEKVSPKEKKKNIERAIRSVNNADLIFTDSYFSKDDIVNTLGVNPNKVVVIYCGVDLSRFNQDFSSEIKSSIAKKYNLPNNYILFSGQARSNKNLANLIKGYSLLSQDNKEKFGLVLTNSTPELVALCNELNVSERVICLNGVDKEDLPALYAMASGLALISFSEGFGLPLIEAMGTGVPTIASNVSCLPEVVGNASLLVNPYDIDDIARGLDQLFNNQELRKELISKGYERSKMFNWDNTAKTFFDEIEKLVYGGK